ncbi:hypothetical protein [Desulforhopalus sp. IMCC35007]|uniref:hypothetical protein n=1 Tax=Desulforhopalus sp. IMCC35007 TaxID=2569543 RepID=UPI0010ADA7FA|nr:hypothetical protein [Desulforhopalus sp. IMCC35007]TKB10326.1 hypothetical protein FCL48_07200 [Desulforhopalus sp. IMCC35007]
MSAVFPWFYLAHPADKLREAGKVMAALDGLVELPYLPQRSGVDLYRENEPGQGSAQYFGGIDVT